MRILDTSCTKAGRKTLKSTASVLGLAAGAIGWSGLANADKSGLQTLLLPDHYRLYGMMVLLCSSLRAARNLALTQTST